MMSAATVHCPSCGAPLRAVAGGVTCSSPCTYTRISMPPAGMGNVFAAGGRPWGALHDRHGHGLVKGWRDTLRGPQVSR